MRNIEAARVVEERPTLQAGGGATPVAVDFEVKTSKLAANQVPSLTVSRGRHSQPVTLRSRDGKLWFGGVSAFVGKPFDIHVAGKINSGGSLTLTVKQVGYTSEPIRETPYEGWVRLGPLQFTPGEEA